MSHILTLRNLFLQQKIKIFKKELKGIIVLNNTVVQIIKLMNRFIIQLKLNRKIRNVLYLYLIKKEGKQNYIVVIIIISKDLIERENVGNVNLIKIEGNKNNIVINIIISKDLIQRENVGNVNKIKKEKIEGDVNILKKEKFEGEVEADHKNSLKPD